MVEETMWLRNKEEGNIQTQSQNFIACCLMERRCDHGGKPMAEEAHAAANKKEELYKPSRKISLPTFFLKKVGGVGESGVLPYPGEQPGTTRRSSEWFCCE